MRSVFCAICIFALTAATNAIPAVAVPGASDALVLARGVDQPHAQDLYQLLPRQANTSASSAASAAPSSASSSSSSAASASASSSSATSSNSSSSSSGTSCTMQPGAGSDPNQSTSVAGTFISTCCVVSNGAICYTRSSTTSGQSCTIPSCSDLASGDASKMNGFTSLTPAATADNPNPMGNGTTGSGSNLTFGSYAPDGKGGNAGAPGVVVQLAPLALAAVLAVAGSVLL